MTAPAFDHGIDSPAAAIDALCARIAVVEAEEVALDDAFGRALAAPIVADRPSPAADVSAMDGYALPLGTSTVPGGGSANPADPHQPDQSESSSARAMPSSTPLGRGWDPDHPISVAFEVHIGQDPGDLPPDACARIVTGAAIPRGAETVLRREDTEERSDSIRIRPGVEIRPGANIRRRGENCAAGDIVLEAGAALTAPAAAACAAFGAARLSVRRPLRLAILITGDELRPLGEPITEFQIRDSNGPTLAAMFAGKPWIGAIERARAADDPRAIRDALSATFEQGADAAIVTGGVSMGDHDHVPHVVRSLGAEVLFHKLPQRPGKPMLGAVLGGVGGGGGRGGGGATHPRPSRQPRLSDGHRPADRDARAGPPCRFPPRARPAHGHPHQPRRQDPESVVASPGAADPHEWGRIATRRRGPGFRKPGDRPGHPHHVKGLRRYPRRRKLRRVHRDPPRRLRARPMALLPVVASVRFRSSLFALRFF